MSDLKGFKSEDILLSKEEAKIWGEMYTDIIYNEGIKRGEKSGISQGKNKTLLDTIKKMLKKNISLNDIKDITGKSIQEIKDIANTM